MFRLYLVILISYMLQGCCQADCDGEYFIPCDGVRKGFINVHDSFYTYYPFTGDSSFILKNQQNYKVSYLSVPVTKDSFVSQPCDSHYTYERISKTFIPDKAGMQISYEWTDNKKFIIKVGDMIFRLDSTRDNEVKYYKEIKVNNNLTLYDVYTIQYNWRALLYYSKSHGILALGENYNLWQRI